MAKSPRPNTQGQPRDTKRRWAKLCLALLTVIVFIATVVLGVFVMVGCVSSSSAISNLFLAELRSNGTDYDIHLRFGYFGGCVIMSNIASPDAPLSYCIMNLRASDANDLNEEFCEKLNLPAGDQTDRLQDALNAMLPVAKNLQTSVFNWEPPLVSLLLFLISSIMLLVAVTAVSPKRRYKATLFIAVLFAAFAIASALVADVGSRQAAAALLDGDPTLDSRPLGSFFVQSADKNLQYIVQDAAAACVALFYVILGVIFVRRDPEDKTPFGFPHHVTINQFTQN